ncbi:MAG: cupredoxin domain-containing protein [Gemmatimonadales bacterium]
MKHQFGFAAIGSTVVALVLAAAACGGGGDDDGAEGPAADCTPVSSDAAHVDQDNLKFSPSELCVVTGQEITFKNSESAIHTVSLDKENLSGTMKQGDEFRWTAAEAGTYQFTCDFHPQMKASISVREAGAGQ